MDEKPAIYQTEVSPHLDGENISPSVLGICDGSEPRVVSGTVLPGKHLSRPSPRIRPQGSGPVVCDRWERLCGWWRSLPCVLLCWASEGSGRGQRSCGWSRCRWATASSRWRTGSRPSAPDPRRTGLKEKTAAVISVSACVLQFSTKSDHKKQEKAIRYASLWWNGRNGKFREI